MPTPSPVLKPSCPSGRFILFRADLAQRYACTLRTVDRDHAAGILPVARYRAGKKSPMWYLSDIEQREKLRPDLRRKAAFAKVKKPTARPPCQLLFRLAV
jgi:hypothetical protein